MLLNLKKATTISALVLSAGLTFGCATTKDLEAVRADAQRAEATANQAQATANEARSMAADASACCKENTDKMDRMFKRSMYK
jgi:hypothetical protein